MCRTTQIELNTMVLNDPIMPTGDTGSLLAAAQWVQGTIVGSVATIIAVLAIAGIGFAWLSGRIMARKAAWTITGCFILFGAPLISMGLTAVSTQHHLPRSIASSKTNYALAIPEAAPDYDPYAGASLRPRN